MWASPTKRSGGLCSLFLCLLGGGDPQAPDVGFAHKAFWWFLFPDLVPALPAEFSGRFCLFLICMFGALDPDVGSRLQGVLGFLRGVMFRFFSGLFGECSGRGVRARRLGGCLGGLLRPVWRGGCCRCRTWGTGCRRGSRFRRGRS